MSESRHTANDIVATARAALEPDGHGRPRHRSSGAILAAIDHLARTAGKDTVQEILLDGCLAGSAERCEEHVAPLMRRIEGGAFAMGTNPQDTRHFCGEAPRHTVRLSAFEIGQVPVTSMLFALLNPSRGGGRRADRERPAVNVSWHEAVLFALWMGCRLPSEAEWEYACGGGSDGEWCCTEEADLVRHAWYSDNAGGRLHSVATREPNSLGLFDVHGNVWEWCVDAYDQYYYYRSPRTDPVSVDPTYIPGVCSAERSCRGGSLHALAEMCRTRYRSHEPAHYWASDLGFRLARSKHVIGDGVG